jgi:two-component system sensor histidine kinase VicK
MEMLTENFVSIEQIGALSDDVYFVFDEQLGTFTYISNAFQQVWQASPVTVKETPQLLFETLHPEDRNYVKHFLSQVRNINNKNANKIEFRIVIADGTVKWIQLKVIDIQEPRKKQVTVGIATDITVIKTNILYAEKINARKNSTLEILAHDLKTPLGMINMMASAIQKLSISKGDNNIVNYVELIQNLCARNIELIRSIVNQEFEESTAVDLRIERSNIVWGITDIINNYKRSADIIFKNFIISSSSDKLYIEMDALKLMQVFNNLISNALKFTPDYGTIDINIEESDETVLVTIGDNGIGIPGELQPYLFDKFTRAQRVGLKGEKPVGIGMSIIKTIVELHRGKIWFESEVGVGSVFYVEIPKQTGF